MDNLTTRTRSIVLCALFIALITLGAKITIPMPITPFTLQAFFCVMSGAMLGGNLGALSVLLYTILGLAGLPVFATGGGLVYLSQPTFGYIIGFIVEAFIVGKVIERMPRFDLKKVLIINLIGIAIVYILGIAYYIFICTVIASKAFKLLNIIWGFCIIFLPKDIALSFLTTLLTKRLWRLRLTK